MVRRALAGVCATCICLLTYTSGASAGIRLTMFAAAALASTPALGMPSVIPGTIQAEDFDNGGEGVAYHDEDAVNSGGLYRTTGVDIERSSEGGYDVGWIAR